MKFENSGSAVDGIPVIGLGMMTPAQKLSLIELVIRTPSEKRREILHHYGVKENQFSLMVREDNLSELELAAGRVCSETIRTRKPEDIAASRARVKQFIQQIVTKKKSVPAAPAVLAKKESAPVAENNVPKPAQSSVVNEMKELKVRETDCFPTMESDAKLPRAIPVAEIQEKIGRVQEMLFGTVNTLFGGTNKVGLLVKNRSLLRGLLIRINEILITSNAEKGATHLETFGDLRRKRLQIGKSIKDAQRGHPKFKDRHLDENVAHAAREQLARISQEYADEITPHLPEQMNATIAVPQEKKKENVTLFKPISSVANGTWMHELTETDARRLVFLLRSPIEGKSNRERLDKFLRGTESRFATNTKDRAELVKKILDSIPFNTSRLHKWMDEYSKQIAEQNGQSDDEHIEETNGHSESLNGNGHMSSVKTLDPLTPEMQAKLTSKQVLEYVETITTTCGDNERAIRAELERLNINWTTYRLWREQHDDYETAVVALDELRTQGTITSKKMVRCSDDTWRFLFADIRRALVEEIERGDSSFGLDEIDIAFEFELKQRKLWTKYSNGKFSVKDVTTDSPQEEEIHPSMIGFTPEQIVHIPRDDREAMNELFAKISPESCTLASLSTDDAVTLREIARYVLKHEDSLSTLMSRLHIASEELVWKLINKYDLSLLDDEETVALARLEEELATLQRMKNELPENYENSIQPMTIRMALYRRLLRLTHGNNVEEKIAFAADVLGVEPDDIEKWERKDFAGLKNADLAQDLFPSQTVDNIDDVLALFAKPERKSKKTAAPKVATPAPEIAVPAGDEALIEDLAFSTPETFEGTVNPTQAVHMFLGATMALLGGLLKKK